MNQPTPTTTAPDDTDDDFIPRDTSEFDRGLSYFDAIYGFAVTLLIANVDAPDPEAWHDFATLADSGLGEQFIGLVLSFVVITVIWRVNVSLVQQLTGLNGPTMVANLVAAGLIIVIPFTTQGISDPGSGDYALPTFFYALNIAAVSLAQITMYQLGRRAGLEKHPTPGRDNLIRLCTAAVTPAIFLLSTPLAIFIGPHAAQLSWLSLIILLPLSGWLHDRLTGRTASAGRPTG